MIVTLKKEDLQGRHQIVSAYLNEIHWRNILNIDMIMIISLAEIHIYYFII